VLFLHVVFACAEDTVDALEKDLQDLKQTHQETSAQNMSDFLAQTLAASQSADVALDLYQKSRGSVPDGAPVQTQHARETSAEKAAREAQDAAKFSNLALAAQLHCGMLHYAALYVTSPDQKGLKEEWLAWLKSMPQVFTQIKDDDLKQTKALMKTPMRDSVIATAFNFYSWGNKDQAGWTVGDLPEFYHKQVLEPLRQSPNADTLAAWDVYISLRNAVQPDSDKWTIVEYPALMFDRASDDYKGTPSMEKLQVMVDLIKANPKCPTLDDMLSRVHDMVKDYRSRHPGAATPQGNTATASSTTPPVDPNVKVTTTKEGDMTIVTTQTNAAATAQPAPPQ